MSRSKERIPFPSLCAPTRPHGHRPGRSASTMHGGGAVIIAEMHCVGVRHLSLAHSRSHRLVARAHVLVDLRLVVEDPNQVHLKKVQGKAEGLFLKDLTPSGFGLFDVARGETCGELRLSLAEKRGSLEGVRERGFKVKYTLYPLKIGAGGGEGRFQKKNRQSFHFDAAAHQAPPLKGQTRGGRVRARDWRRSRARQASAHALPPSPIAPVDSSPAR